MLLLKSVRFLILFLSLDFSFLGGLDISLILKKAFIFYLRGDNMTGVLGWIDEWFSKGLFTLFVICAIKKIYLNLWFFNFLNFNFHNIQVVNILVITLLT